MAEFKCANGKVYIVPDRCCLTCGHCTDVLYDSHGPYLTFCELNLGKGKACMQSGYKKWVWPEWRKSNETGND